MKPNKPVRKKIDPQSLKPNRKLKNVDAPDNICPVCYTHLKVDTEGYWSCTKDTCFFNSRNVNPTQQITTSIPDPIFVKRIERSLKRKLTEEELNGESKLWELNGTYLTSFVNGGVEVKIPKVQFPEEV